MAGEWLKTSCLHGLFMLNFCSVLFSCDVELVLFITDTNGLKNKKLVRAVRRGMIVVGSLLVFFFSLFFFSLFKPGYSNLQI